MVRVDELIIKDSESVMGVVEEEGVMEMEKRVRELRVE